MRGRSRSRISARSALAGVLLGLVLVACTTERGHAPMVDTQGASGSEDAVRIGSFHFTESELLAEIYAQTLERGGVEVDRTAASASREIVEPAMEADLIDLVPEYSGTALEFLELGRGVATADPVVTHSRLQKALAPRGLRALDIAPAQNSNGFVVTRETAQELELRQLSDLRTVAPQLVFGGPPECPERPLCLDGLRDVYGLEFLSFRALDVSGPLTLAALLGGEVDVAMMFTTSAVGADEGVVFLEDDREMQPADNVVPIVREEVVARLGADLVRPLNALSERLTTPTLAELVRRAERGGEDPADLASAWLDAEGL